MRAFLLFHYKDFSIRKMNEEELLELWCEYVYVKKCIGEIKES